MLREKRRICYGTYPDYIDSWIRGSNPRAGVAFVMAKGAVEAGHKPEILLAGDAAVLGEKGCR
jgi:predicted peroxiredoxin